jgi:hypothetical protein
MSTQTVCAKCGGTGWLIVERANVSGAKACECRAEGRADRLEERSQVPPLYREASFENFSVPGTDNPIARRGLTTVLLSVNNALGFNGGVKIDSVVLNGGTLSAPSSARSPGIVRSRIVRRSRMSMSRRTRS